MVVLSRMRNRIDPLQLSERIRFPSIFHKPAIPLSSKVYKLDLICLMTSMYCNGIWSDDAGRYIQMFSWHDMVVINSPVILPEIFPHFHSVAISSRHIRNCDHLFLAKGHSSRRLKYKVLLWRGSSRLSGGASDSTLCVTFWS